MVLPTGQVITPAAAPGSSFERLEDRLTPGRSADAAEAVTIPISLNGKTLLGLTSVYNQGVRS